MIPRTGPLTILLIAADRLVRADLHLGKSRVQGLWQRARPDADDLPMLVDVALRQSKKRARRVLVLADAFWTQTMHLPGDTMLGLDREEQSRVLAFEVESISGVGAVDSVVGFAPLTAGDRPHDFWITQLAAWQRDQVDETVRQAGGALIGIGHPGGLPRPMTPVPEGEAWEQIELWSGAIVCRRQLPGQPLELHILNTDCRQRGWQTGVESWSSALVNPAHRSWIVADDAANLTGLTMAPGTTVARLSDEAALRAWLTGWATALRRREVELPCVVPVPRPLSAGARLAIAAGLAGVVAAGCYFQWTHTEEHIKRLDAEAATLKARTSQLADLGKQATDQRTKCDKGMKELAALDHDVEHNLHTLRVERRRWQWLLTLLAAYRPDELVVQKIESHEDGLKVSGLCLGSQPANQLSVDLGETLSLFGWQVDPARQEIGTITSHGDPWKFELILIDSEIGMPPTNFKWRTRLPNLLAGATTQDEWAP